MNYFRGVHGQPYHLSVGAVLVNDDGKIACHYFDSFRGFKDVHVLMRETLNPREKLEEALARGLMEDFGATGQLLEFLGTIVSIYHEKQINQDIEKTTLYFLCKLQGQDLGLRANDEERVIEIRWMDPAELKEKMKEQGARYARTDLNEAVIVERAERVLKI